MPRRDFIRNTSLAAAGVTIINFPIRGKAACNKVIVAVMGVNSRGAYLAKSALLNCRGGSNLYLRRRRGGN